MNKKIKNMALILGVLLTGSVHASVNDVKYNPIDVRINHNADITYTQEGDSTYYQFTKKIDFHGFKLTKTRILPLDAEKLKKVNTDKEYKSKLLSEATTDLVTVYVDTQYGKAQINYEQNVALAKQKVTNKNDILSYVDYTKSNGKYVMNSIYGMDTVKFLGQRAMALNPKQAALFSSKDESKIRDDIQLLLDQKFPGIYNVKIVTAY